MTFFVKDSFHSITWSLFRTTSLVSKIRLPINYSTKTENLPSGISTSFQNDSITTEFMNSFKNASSSENIITTSSRTSDTQIKVDETDDSRHSGQVLEPAQYALLHRMGIFDKVDHFLARSALDHISIIPGHLPSSSVSIDCFNGLLFIGANCVKYFITEALNIKFPKLSVSDTMNAIAIMTDSPILDDIVTKFSLDRALICLDPSSASGEPTTEFISNAARKSLLALLGSVVVSTKSTTSIFPFVKFNFISALDGTISHSVIPSPNEAPEPASTPAIVKSRFYPLRDFRYSLFLLSRRLGYEKPVYRLEGETGRQSTEPLYIVGVYCGNIKLGESFAQSITLAETRAARDALERYYLEEERNISCFPSEMEDKDNPIEFVPLSLYDAFATAIQAPNVMIQQ